MLAYFLALAVGLGSFSFYMAAFFFPEVHRKSDFVWSGVGFFYALVLWACAGRVTGVLLLGQMAGVALLGWLAWETLSLRRQVTPIAQQTPIPESANLKAVAGGSFPAFFGQKKDTAPKKPKFVRSNKPKAEVTVAPVPNTSDVKVEEQSATPPVAELISENAIAPTTETAPAESAPSNETPLPLEVSEIATGANVEPAEPQPEAKPEPEVDDFEETWRAAAKESLSAASSVAPTAASAANSTPAKVSKKSAGFGSLFGNIKNSVGGFLGRGSDKNKSAGTSQTATPKVPPTESEPVAEIPAIPAPDIDQILESELAEVAAEAAETSTTAVEETPGVPFPTDVEAMAELMVAETASSPLEIAETPIEPSETQAQTSSETEVAELTEPSETEAKTSPETEVAELTETADVPEAKVPISPLEMTAVEVVSVTTVKIQESSDSIDSSPKLEVETISIEVVSIEPTSEEQSQQEEKPQLIRPNPPDPDLVEAAQPAAESKSENISSEQPPTA